MKRKLEAELISIAHRILKLKNKSELAQLQQETLKLYEKISVLRFVEENFSEVKPTIGFAAAEKKVAAFFEEEEQESRASLIENEPEEPIDEVTTEPESDVEVTEEADIEEVAAENIEDESTEDEVLATEEEVAEEPETVEEVEEEIEEAEPDFAPLFEISKEDAVGKANTTQITFEDFLGEAHLEPVFVRAEEVHSTETTTTTNELSHETITKVEVVDTKKTEFIVNATDSKNVSLNDRLSKTINIGLNDRIGFEKHLFGGSSEDLNRVLSQLSTFSNFSEAEEFIEDMVKPDYNNWNGKDEYATRFMELVEKKFS